MESPNSGHRLVVAGVPEHFNLPWHLAIESNAFQFAGIDLSFVEFPGGTGAMTAALDDGTIDLAVLLTEGCVNYLNAGSPNRIVKRYVKSPLVWGIHVAANSSIQTVDQIRDHRYAISRLGSGSHLMAIVDACERGWPHSQMQFEVVDNLDGARRSLAKGESDVFFWEKYTTKPFVDRGEFRCVGVRKTLWPAFVICARAACLEQNADQVRKVLQIVNQSCRQLMGDESAVELIANRYNLNPHDVGEWLSMTCWDTGFEQDLPALNQARDYLNMLGIVASENRPIEEFWYPL